MEWWVLLAWMYLAVCMEKVHSNSIASRIVYIEQGPVKGYKATDGNFFVFYGVPYATAPTGKDRFKAPLPPPIWSDPLEAVDKGIICHQKDTLGVIPKSKKMKENCLIATIYVPDTLENDIPVVVYVHGGGYMIGFGDYVTPRNFAKTNKVILVTFNYRLAAHGFLCLGTKDVPGNAGMKDQVALLWWVKRNIGSFGGNPEDVTLAGYSSGSAVVDILMISKMTDGLFNKVIPESGAGLSAFNVQLDPIENAKQYARLLNFTDVDNFYALEEFYKTMSYEVLVSASSFFYPDSTLAFSPCIERDLGEETFLDDSPYNILSSGNYQKLPMLYGFATMEGLFRLPQFELWKNKMNHKFSDFLPGDLQFKNSKQKNEVAKKVKHFYFGTKVSAENILGYVDYFSDVIFIYPILRSTELHIAAGHDKIYFYEYVHVDENTIKIPYTHVRGPDHCAQTWAVLDGLNLTHTNEHLISNSLREMKNVTRELWLNFIITGNPTPLWSSFPTWLPVGANIIPHMVLDHKLELTEHYNRKLERRYQFWDKIYKKYYRMPVPPSPPVYYNILHFISLCHRRIAWITVLIILVHIYFYK